MAGPPAGRLARRDLAAGHRALEPVDDHAVLRIQAALGHLQVADRLAELDPSPLDDVLGADRQDVGSGLVAADRGLRHEQGIGSLCERCTDPGEQAGQQRAIGIREDPAQLERARSRGQRDGGEVELALVREAVLVGDAEVEHLIGRHAGLAGLGALGADAQEIALVDREVGVDRVDLVDLGQHGLAVGADQVAGVDQMPAHAPVERCGDGGVAEIDLGDIDLRLGAEHPGLGLVAVGAPGVDVHRRGGLLLEQARIAVEFGLGVEELRLHRLQLRLRLLQLRLIGVLLQREQQVALLDPLAVLKMDLVQEALHPGHQLHRGHRRRGAGELDEVGDRARHRCRDRHRRRGRCHIGVALLVLAAGEQRRSNSRERERYGSWLGQPEIGWPRHRDRRHQYLIGQQPAPVGPLGHRLHGLRRQEALPSRICQPPPRAR